MSNLRAAEVTTFSPNYTYRVAFLRAIDGDTYVFRVDLGFRCAITLEVRLRGVNAPERRTQPGIDATSFVNGVLTEASEVVIVSYRDRRSFARWVADVRVDGVDLAELLVDEGYATRV